MFSHRDDESLLMAAADTIFALSSGALPSGVAVIRLSGPATDSAVLELCGRLPPERKATLMKIRAPGGEMLDEGLVLRFVGPASFTGEDCAELHVHGGRATVAGLLEILGALPGLRQAEAGEFTRRAFENGRIDLVEAEGLAELLQAQTAAQRRLALHLAEGHLSRSYEAWMERLSRSRALIEAELDFADESDVPGSVSEQVWKDAGALYDELVEALGNRTSEIVKDGFRVAIVGPPNAGKSSLLNYLARRDVAIVTDVAGTTRDVLTVELDIDGMKVVISDTAGLRKTQDPVERIGIQRAEGVIRSADLVLLLSDDGDFEREISERRDLFAPVEMIRISSKADLQKPVAGVTADISLSVVSGAGIDSLLKHIGERAQRLAFQGETVTPLLIRHRNHVRDAAEHVRHAVVGEDLPLEIRAEYLRSAATSLGQLTGRVTADALLGLIFSQFCIGK